MLNATAAAPATLTVNARADADGRTDGQLSSPSFRAPTAATDSHTTCPHSAPNPILLMEMGYFSCPRHSNTPIPSLTPSVLVPLPF